MKIVAAILLSLTLARGQYPDSVVHHELNQPIIPGNVDYGLLQTAIVLTTNQVRAERDYESLLPDSSLACAAALQAEYLSNERALIHQNRSDRKLKTPALRVTECGGMPSAVAENLARMTIFDTGKSGRFFVADNGSPVNEAGQPLPTLSYLELAEKIARGWLESEGHRRNLLGAFSHIGVAVKRMETGKEILPTLVFVQNFGKY